MKFIPAAIIVILTGVIFYRVIFAVAAIGWAYATTQFVLPSITALGVSAFILAFFASRLSRGAILLWTSAAFCGACGLAVAFTFLFANQN